VPWACCAAAATAAIMTSCRSPKLGLPCLHPLELPWPSFGFAFAVARFAAALVVPSCLRPNFLADGRLLLPADGRLLERSAPDALWPTTAPSAAAARRSPTAGAQLHARLLQVGLQALLPVGNTLIASHRNCLMKCPTEVMSPGKRCLWCIHIAAMLPNASFSSTRCRRRG
jgi:hypothetical protein